MAKGRKSNRRRRRGSGGFLYKLLSMLVICAAIIAAITLFFRVDTVVINGQQRYTEEQVLQTTGIEPGDNLFLMNKYTVAGDIISALPYIEEIRINRKLPDTIVIEVRECGKPLALLLEDYAWLFSPAGKIVERVEADAAADYTVVSGCPPLAPTVGTPLTLATDYKVREESLLHLIAALEDAGMLARIEHISLSEVSHLSMDMDDRFTVQMPYEADYSYKLRMLNAVLDSGKIQSNMTGTIDMRSEDGKTSFIQHTR